MKPLAVIKCYSHPFDGEAQSLWVVATSVCGANKQVSRVEAEDIIRENHFVPVLRTAEGTIWESADHSFKKAVQENFRRKTKREIEKGYKACFRRCEFYRNWDNL